MMMLDVRGVNLPCGRTLQAAVLVSIVLRYAVVFCMKFYMMSCIMCVCKRLSSTTLQCLYGDYACTLISARTVH
jgi:hypothetical protein